MRWGPPRVLRAALAAAATGAIAPSQAGAQAACPPPPGNPPGFPNPLHTCAMAEPGMIRTGPTTWYAYGTDRGLADGAMDVYRSTDDRRSWLRVGSVFPPGPGLPRGALNAPKVISGKRIQPSYWAPDVYFVAGRFVIYYSARDARLGWNEIWTATAPGPEGPWKNEGPVVQNNRFSVIDPALVYDAGLRGYYLLWKNDLKGRKGIVLQRLSSDGLARARRPRQLLSVGRQRQPWEGNSVEAPTLVKRGTTYYLFYSGNSFKRGKGGASPYAVGVARAGKLGGPYTKFAGNPILKANARFQGPGHQDVVELGGDQWLLFYHAYPSFLPAGRYLMMDQLRWDRPDGWPRVNDGTPSS